MSKQAIRRPLALALGAAVISTMGVAGIANAEEGEGIFAMEELMSGQLLAGAHEEGGCGEDKDSGEGEDEGSCGEDGGDGEGSCGEGKCGS
ncbi:MAG: hypothetical protein QGH46_08580 [Gammaproteobacteria bacterium]|jgi:uncharacterized low-complexity protein|nr:hypothetical protein [Gammaproteobacteria bacterium]MDP7093102.1 hypothetical protein [Gammaproteobacteria bacterium]MDP7271925.1 hypothetical protein [Gammaproteobacteria bacterium]HJP03577.1 hypothetical protein [Gammaproteobacteria bacterium]